MIKRIRLTTSFFCLLLLASCASIKTSDLPYLGSSKALVESFPNLDVYQPRKSKKNPVIIFIHGGYWTEGNKGIYGFLGRNLARKGVVAAIPNYTLSPYGNYDTMAEEVSSAIQWTEDNIEKFNGDPNRIFLMGHSAGGHLIALVGTNPKYLDNTELIKGIILNDAAGLDMYSYLEENPPTEKYHYDVTWTKEKDNWKDASPIYALSERSPPFFIYVGTKSFPSIISQNNDFIKKLNRYQPNVGINLLPKKHVPMMRQFLFPWNRHYKEIIEFIDSNRKKEVR